MKHILTHSIAILIGIVLTMTVIRVAVNFAPRPEFHEHANIAVFVNGQKMDLSAQKYMSAAPCGDKEIEKTENLTTLADKVHLHDGNGGLIHLHYPGVTYADFFQSIKMKFDDTSLTDDAGTVYAADAAHLFRYFVNGVEVPDLAHRAIHNLDRVLISYGPLQRSIETINAELVAVPDDACIYSNACPGRGTPPPEACAGSEDHEPWLYKFMGIQVK